MRDVWSGLCTRSLHPCSLIRFSLAQLKCNDVIISGTPCFIWNVLLVQMCPSQHTSAPGTLLYMFIDPLSPLPALISLHSRQRLRRQTGLLPTLTWEPLTTPCRTSSKRKWSKRSRESSPWRTAPQVLHYSSSWMCFWIFSRTALWGLFYISAYSTIPI